MPHLVEIAPSILAADFASLGEGIRAVERAGRTRLDVEVMDEECGRSISFR